MSLSRPLRVLFTWNIPQGLDRIKCSRENLEVQVCDRIEDVPRRMADIDVACVGTFNAEMLAAARKLRWVHAFYGGVESLMFPEMVASPIPLTCLKGCFDIPAAEYALAVMLAFTRRLMYDIRQRPVKTFQEFETTELFGKTVGIIGMGSIGTEIAKRCRSFGMTVLGMARSPRPCPPETDEWLTRDRLPDLLRRSDFVVMAVPNTTETRGMIGPAELAQMKQSAYLIDVTGRPVMYDLDALANALQTHRIAGANLQMQATLPPDSPLWDVENLLISFHRTISKEQYGRALDRFCENLRRFDRGQPLLGVVDKRAGY